MVAGMQEELNALQPELKKKSKETEEMLIEVNKDRASADEKKEIVAVEEAKVKKSADEVQEKFEKRISPLEDQIVRRSSHPKHTHVHGRTCPTCTTCACTMHAHLHTYAPVHVHMGTCMHKGHTEVHACLCLWDARRMHLESQGMLDTLHEKLTTHMDSVMEERTSALQAAMEEAGCSRFALKEPTRLLKRHIVVSGDLTSRDGAM